MQHSPFNIQVFFNVEWCLRECCSLVHPAPHTFSGSQTQLSHTHSTRNARGAHSSPTCRAQRSRSRKPETELTEHTVEFVTHDSRKLLLPPRTRPQCRLPPPRVPRATRVTRPSRSRSSTACHETAGAKSATRRFPSSRWPSPLRRTRLSTGLSWVSVDAVCAMRALRRVSSQEPRSRLR